MPRDPYCKATDFVRRTTPAFDAPYAARTPRPMTPSIDAVLTIEPPPRVRMCGIGCLQPIKHALEIDGDEPVEDRHIEVTMSVSAAAVEASDALLCNTSRPPNDATAVSTIRTTLDSSETSTSATTALPSSPATRSAADPSMSATRRVRNCARVADQPSV